MSNITMQDLLQNHYERPDFDEVLYTEIFHLYEGVARHYNQMENPFSHEARLAGHNYIVLRGMILDKLQEPGYS